MAARNSGSVLWPAWSVRNAVMTALAVEGADLRGAGDQGRALLDDGAGVGEVEALSRGQVPLVAADACLVEYLGQDGEAAGFGPYGECVLLGGLQGADGVAHVVSVRGFPAWPEPAIMTT